jgi:hypothetical protein
MCQLRSIQLYRFRRRSALAWLAGGFDLFQSISDCRCAGGLARLRNIRASFRSPHEVLRRDLLRQRRRGSGRGIVANRWLVRSLKFRSESHYFLGGYRAGGGEPGGTELRLSYQPLLSLAAKSRALAFLSRVTCASSAR